MYTHLVARRPGPHRQPVLPALDAHHRAQDVVLVLQRLPDHAQHLEDDDDDDNK